MNPREYPGKELESFAAATVWKAYLARHLAPYLGRRVLEVGAGAGGTTRALAPTCRGEWWCLEPDPDLAQRIAEAIREGELPARCHLLLGTLRDIPSGEQYDSILYSDVLEHIENDRDELADAAERLAPGGHLVVIAPAHPWVFSPFDAAIGHRRRYVKRSLTALTPDALRLVRLIYLDAVGLLASVGNRSLLRREMPTRGQVLFWDRVLVRLSKVVDPLTGHRFGKSILGVWKESSGGR
jgi:SAM-dependent methyltransferase